MEKIHSLAVIGNYFPRRCGIATFTTDLVTALSTTLDSHCWAVAMNDKPEGYRYPEKVRFEINQNNVNDYMLAADFLNTSHVEGVSLQHEYGIYGGDSGNYILKLLENLHMPVVTTLHTVLRDPTHEQKDVLNRIASLSAGLVVMSHKSEDFLKDIYHVPEEKIHFIPHGIPDQPFSDPDTHKARFGVQGRSVILTFGLLSPNKGIETMIEALPEIVEKHPDVLYVVVGATHPHVLQLHGEEYRQGLERLAQERGVEKNITFYNRFVSFEELCDFLAACDIYVTPYLNEAQAVSGTLAYAVGLGKPVVSTPYWHASEMLANGRGVLVGFKNSSAMADEINRLLGDETLCNTIRKKAYSFSRKAVWSNVAREYLSIFQAEKTERLHLLTTSRLPLTLDKGAHTLPAINFSHLKTMTDDTGLLQHAIYTIPNYAEGYCIDDNARALIVTIMAAIQTPESNLLVLQKRYLAFLAYAFNTENGWFRNFMSYDRKWLEERGSEDSQGRAVWGLGICSAISKDSGSVTLSASLLHKALPMIETLKYPRAIAFALLGLNAHLTHFPGDTTIRRTRDVLAKQLFSLFPEHPDQDWPWFEDKLSYANAKIPQALLLSGYWMENQQMIQTGRYILDWLIRIQTQNGVFSPVGNNGWLIKNAEKSCFDQQPLEAEGMIEAGLLAFRITSERSYREAAERAFNWFLGQNDLNAPLYDYTTGGCRDGLTPNGPNRNQGTESTLAWLHAVICMHNFQAGRSTFQYLSTIENEQ